MSTISAIQVEAALLKGGAGAGGTEALMATLNGKILEEMDDLLATYNAELVGINAEVTSLRQERNNFSVFLDDGEPGPITLENGTIVDGVIWDTGSFPVELEELLKAYGYVEEYVPGNSSQLYITNTVIDAVKEDIDGEIQEKNSSTELKMINFQAIMDSRKQALLMLSNLLNSDNTAKQAIIQNMKG